MHLLKHFLEYLNCPFSCPVCRLWYPLWSTRGGHRQPGSVVQRVGPERSTLCAAVQPKGHPLAIHAEHHRCAVIRGRLPLKGAVRERRGWRAREGWKGFTQQKCVLQSWGAPRGTIGPLCRKRTGFPGTNIEKGSQVLPFRTYAAKGAFLAIHAEHRRCVAIRGRLPLKG